MEAIYRLFPVRFKLFHNTVLVSLWLWLTDIWSVCNVQTPRQWNIFSCFLLYEKYYMEGKKRMNPDHRGFKIVGMPVLAAYCGQETGIKAGPNSLATWGGMRSTVFLLYWELSPTFLLLLKPSHSPTALVVGLWESTPTFSPQPAIFLLSVIVLGLSGKLLCGTGHFHR